MDDFEAIELPFGYDVKSVALFTFDNDIISWFSVNFLHGINNNADIFLVETAEEDAFFDEIFDDFFGLGVFGDHFCHEIGFLVELSEDFRADSLPTVLFVQFLLLFLLQFSQKLSLLFFGFFI